MPTLDNNLVPATPNKRPHIPITNEKNKGKKIIINNKAI
jgi:hypothetical protein